MKELIKKYFKRINRLDLFGDKSINFLMNGQAIPHKSKKMIKNFIGGVNIGRTIVVNDNDKIKSSRIN